MTIANIYTKEVITIEPDAPLKHAAHLMRDIFVGAVVVVIKENNREKPVGLITDHDIVTKGVSGKSDLSTLKVKDIMNPNIVTTTENALVSDCLSVMKEKRIKRIPVVDDDGYLKGILSVSDLTSVAHQMMAMLTDILKPA